MTKMINCQEVVVSYFILYFVEEVIFYQGENHESLNVSGKENSTKAPVKMLKSEKSQFFKLNVGFENL